tara:strand:- start:129 stop:1553 length:1425 start_codon:yes stop_codon:yes gene_type:complete
LAHKIKVKYINNLEKVSSYFWTRAIRTMPDGRYGVNISGKVYPLYRGNFINHDDKNDLSLKECPIAETNEAKAAVGKLPLLDSKFSELVGKNINDQVILKENNDNSITIQVDGKEYDESAIKFNIGEIIHYEDVPGFSFPKYNDDWYIEKRDTGLYVTVNESDSRIENIKGILSNPEKYNCIDVGGGKSTFTPDINEFGEPVYPDDVTLYLPPDPINENIDINKKTFFSRYGEFDFFHSKSFKPAPNNIQYDYFFRFEPTIPENLIKDMFEDILRVSEASKLLHELESFLNHDDVENEQTDELIKKIQTLDKDKSQSDELVNLYSKELEELRDEFIELNNNHQKLINSHESLKERYTKARRRNVTFFEKRMHKYLNIEILPRGLKAVNKHFEDTQKLEDIIYQMDGQDRNMRLKKVHRTKSWKEVDQKISNGYDNQGRLYICMVNNKKIVLIGHKQDQTEDIAFMIKNDPPTLD